MSETPLITIPAEDRAWIAETALKTTLLVRETTGRRASELLLSSLEVAYARGALFGANDTGDKMLAILRGTK